MADLDDAWAEAEAAIPDKRWSIWLSGGWEDGWEAEVSSWTLGERATTIVQTNDSGWFHDPGDLPTPAAALRELTKRLRASKVETAAGDSAK